MKILTVVRNLQKGGTQRSAQVFAEGYKKLNNDSRVLALYGLGSRYEEIKNTLEVYHGLSKENLHKISSWAPDIVHIHSHGLKKEDIFSLLKVVGRDGVKIIETNVFSTPSPWASALDCSFQLSSWCQWLYEQRGGKDHPKAIVPNPIKCEAFFPQTSSDIDKFRESYQIPQDAFVIGRIGQSEYANWSTRLIDIFDQLHNSGYRPYLLLVSPPKEIIDRVNVSKYNDHIVITDYLIGDDSLRTAYCTMDIFVHIASAGESFGYVNAEAVLCGVPSITFMTPWNSNSQVEVVQNDICGHVVHHHDTAVKLIKEYMDGTRVYDKEQGINSIKQRYDYLKICEAALNKALAKEFAKPITLNEIYSILNRSCDKPNFMTLMFLKNNHKKLTKYSSGYEGRHKLFTIIFKKAIRFLSKGL